MPDLLFLLLAAIYLSPLLLDAVLWGLPPALLALAVIHWGPAMRRRVFRSA